MKRTELVGIRFTPQEFEVLRKQAYMAKRTISDFIRVSVMNYYMPMPAKRKPSREDRSR